MLNSCILALCYIIDLTIAVLKTAIPSMAGSAGVSMGRRYACSIHTQPAYAWYCYCVFKYYVFNVSVFTLFVADFKAMRHNIKRLVGNGVVYYLNGSVNRTPRAGPTSFNIIKRFYTLVYQRFTWFRQIILGFIFFSQALEWFLTVIF